MAPSLTDLNRSQEYAGRDPFTLDRYRQMAASIPKSATHILDAGCASGQGGPTLAAAFPSARITGLDIVPERVAAIPRPPYEQGICASMHDTGMPDKSVDAIVAGETIEHLPPNLIDPTLCEFFRILTLRGRLILTTPNPESLRFRIKGWSVLLEDSHLSQHPARILSLRLQMAGFRNIRFCGSGRSTRYYGTRLPLFAYGSYLCTAEKW